MVQRKRDHAPAHLNSGILGEIAQTHACLEFGPRISGLIINTKKNYLKLQQPATRPKIDESVYKAAYALRKERPERRWVEIQGEAVILIPSSHGMAEFGTLETAGNMVPLFNQLKFSDDGPFASWANYKEIRSKFHIIRPSKIWQSLSLRI